MKRPLSNYRPLGPFVSSSNTNYVPEGESEAREWKSDDANHTRDLKAPEGWDWQVDDQLAHHVWQLTANSNQVGFGPDPPVLLEAFMGFFPEKGITAGLNNWYNTRKKGRDYDDYTTWWQVGNQFNSPQGDPDRTDILYSVDTVRAHPIRSKLSSQQYTVNGGMFTYDFTQWQGELPTGMMRIPVDSSLLEDLRRKIEPTVFEEFQMQSRSYSLGSQYAKGGVADGTYAHPHFRAESETTLQDYKQLFDIAFEFMEESVEVER